MRNKTIKYLLAFLIYGVTIICFITPAIQADTINPPFLFASNDAVTVPAGTHLMVRMTDTINSRTHGEGHRFTAKLEGDLVVNGKVVAPMGSKVYGQLSKAEKSGRLVGRSKMTITFTHLMINGHLKPIQTTNIQAVDKKGTGRDTVGKTARGTAIGALADGRDGARQGAKIGLGVAILTRGRSVNIPSGTLLDLTLAAPFTP